MVTEKHLNDIEEASDILFESTQRAIAVREAIHELGQMDDRTDYDLFIDPAQLKSPRMWDNTW